MHRHLSVRNMHVQPVRKTDVQHRAPEQQHVQGGDTSIEMRPPGLSAVRFIALLFCININHILLAAIWEKLRITAQ